MLPIKPEIIRTWARETLQGMVRMQADLSDWAYYEGELTDLSRFLAMHEN